MASPTLGIRPTVFVKLAGILTLTGIAVSAFIIFGMRVISLPGAPERAVIEANVEAYIRSLAAEAGEPPSLLRMREIARRTGLELKAYGPTGEQIATRDDLPEVTELTFTDGEFSRSAARPGYGERPYAVVPAAQSWRLVVFGPVSAFLAGNTRVILTIVILTVFAFVMGGFAARKVLRPMNALAEGVNSVAEGRLDVTLPEDGQDELRDLARGFNAMTRRIVAMIKAREQLLLDVSHELRSPISRMMMMVGMMPPTNERLRMEKNLKEMEEMIGGVLELARLDSSGVIVEKSRVELGEALSFAVSLFDPRVVKVAVQIPERPVLIRADQRELQVVLRNLIENAAKYSDGKIAPIEASVSTDGGQAIFEVKDRGIGIPAGDLPYVTEPFYRVDRSRSKTTGGFGLGLSLCQRIVNRHKGTLEVRSGGLGQGTTVRVTLPLDS